MAPTILWLTSRSAHEKGTQMCPMARFLEYSAGPYSYGFQRRALSLPLVTGTYVDKPLSAICQWIIDATESTGTQPTAPPDEVIRWAATLAVTKYRAVVDKRRILTLSAEDPATLQLLQLLITEQCHLIESLVWMYALVRLPQILQTYRLRAVQPEETFVVACTCGLGDRIGEIADHESRGCLGIGEQSRPDLLAERFSDNQWAYFEFKTASAAKREWNESWEKKPQFLMGVVGAERRLGVEISHAWVEGIVKGQRKRDYPYTDDKPKTQQSALCYAYLRESNPGLTAAEWRPSREYYDPDGMKHTVSRDFRRTAIWNAPDDAFYDITPEQSRAEWWTKYLLKFYPQTLVKSLNVIGPLPKQVNQIEKAIRSSVAEETLWRSRLWQIYDWQVTNKKGWGDPEYHQFVETVVPRSWNCHPFGPTMPCVFVPICFDEEGAADPIGSGLYVHRLPHHSFEAKQMEARGLKPEEGVGFEEDEAEEDWG